MTDWIFLIALWLPLLAFVVYDLVRKERVNEIIGDATDDEHRARERLHWLKQERFNVFTGLFSLTVAVAAVAAAVFAGFAYVEVIKQVAEAKRGADEAHRQADAAETTFSGLERPYVFVEQITNAKQGSPTSSFRPSPFEYSVKNFGRTPAIVRTIQTTAYINEFIPPGTRKPIDFAEIFNGRHIPAAGGDSWTVEAISIGTLPVINPMVGTIMIEINIAYLDVFGAGHCTENLYFMLSSKFVPVGVNRQKSDKHPPENNWPGSWCKF